MDLQPHGISRIPLSPHKTALPPKPNTLQPEAVVEQKLALILALCSQHTLGQPVYYVIFSKKS